MENNMEKVKIRHSHGCIYETDIVKLKNYKKFDVDLNVMGEVVTRKMVKINLPHVNVMVKDQDYEYAKKKDFYVDVVTGTMYDPKTGRGNSSKIFIEAVHS